jgi:hypothetical protein
MDFFIIYWPLIIWGFLVVSSFCSILMIHWTSPIDGEGIIKSSNNLIGLILLIVCLAFAYIFVGWWWFLFNKTYNEFYNWIVDSKFRIFGK